MIDLPGLLAAAALLSTLVALEVRHTGQDSGQPARARLLGRTVSRTVGRTAVAAVWVVFLVLFVPRVWELIT
jgi:hypothetical protein